MTRVVHEPSSTLMARLVEEGAHRWWLTNGQPDWSAFGVTVTPGDQHVWFGSAESDQRWPLPLP
ncbi:hypothetical protein [Nocardiopsis sp. M1B1]|uniref:hypothetical protein n=1 Tax=Nocardiopsis sp. M1B1 TaxID=3450454 RepID=UPI00403A16C0